jgi:CheY-like chemotaxis protein
MAPLVLAAVTDLFLQSRILEVAKPLGFQVRFVKDGLELAGRPTAANPSLMILDLASEDYDPFSYARTLKMSFPSMKILGFFPHVRTELSMRAKTSGIDYIVPNSGLIKTLKSILATREGQ